MGKTNQLGVLADVFTSDASNNVGIGGSPSGSYKLEVTGTAKVSGVSTLTGNVFLSNGSGNAVATLGGSPTGNDGASLSMIPSNSAINWAIRVNWNLAGALEFCPSTAGGGSTFSSTPSFYLSSTGLATFSSFGSHSFSSAGTGYNKLTIRNTTAGTGNGAQLSIGTNADPDQFYVQSFATTFTTSGMNIAGGAVVNGEGPGGLSIAATQSNIGFYTNGAGAANLRMNIASDGLIQLYAGTNQATGGAYNTFGNLYVASTSGQGTDIGGSISIGGKFNGAGAYATFARIQGKKENSSSGQTGGYLAFEVCTDVTNLNTERLRISSTGVATFTSTTTNLDNITIKNGSNKTNVTIGSAGGTAAFGGMQMYDNSSQVAVYLITDSTANSYVYSGFSIGASLASYKLQISTDSAGKPNGGSWANSSDIRLKENIKTIDNALDKITQLRGVTFDWKDETEQDNIKSSGGFIADEVMLTFPNWVRDVNASSNQKELINDDKVKSLSLPFEFDAMLVEAIKELSAQNQDLKSRLDKAGL